MVKVGDKTIRDKWKGHFSSIFRYDIDGAVSLPNATDDPEHHILRSTYIRELTHHI